MAHSAAPSESAGVERIFLAAWLDEEALAALAPVDEWILGLGSHRLVPREQRHITVAFLGDLDAAQRDAVVRAAGAACAQSAPLEARMGRVLALPAPGTPRVLAMGFAGDTGLPELLARVGGAAVEAANTATARRALDRDPHPHATLARAKGSHRPRSVDLRSVPPIDGRAVVRAIDVVRSRLTDAGPRYQRVSTCPLGRHTTG